MHGDIVQEDLAAKFSRLEAASVAALFRSLDELLEDVTVEMRAHERSYAGEKSETAEARDARDEAHAELADSYQRVRGIVEGIFGGSRLANFGFSTRTEEYIKPLAEQAGLAVSELRKEDADEDAEDAEDDGFAGLFDADKLADRLAEPLERAEELLAEIESESREDQAAMLERDAVIVEWELTYRGVATTLQGLFLLAGRSDLADRVRPTTRRAKGKETPPEADDEAPATDSDPVVDDEPVADEA